MNVTGTGLTVVDERVGGADNRYAVLLSVVFDPSQAAPTDAKRFEERVHLLVRAVCDATCAQRMLAQAEAPTFEHRVLVRTDPCEQAGLARELNACQKCVGDRQPFNVASFVGNADGEFDILPKVTCGFCIGGDASEPLCTSGTSKVCESAGFRGQDSGACRAAPNGNTPADAAGTVTLAGVAVIAAIFVSFF